MISKIWVHSVLLIEAAILYVLKVCRVPTLKTASGVRLYAQYNDRSFRYAVSRAFQRDSYFQLLENMGGPFAFIDVGANQGSFTIPVARMPDCRGVVAFEPSSKNATLLRSNLRLNDCESKVRVFEKGLGESTKEALLTYNPKHSGNSQIAIGSVDEPLASRGTNGVIEDVEIWGPSSLETNLKSESILRGSEKIHVKIDTEGGEDKILDSILKTAFSSRVVSVRVEVSRYNSESKIRELLESNGFTERLRVGNDLSHFDLVYTRSFK